jgi:hypothetical protein
VSEPARRRTRAWWEDVDADVDAAGAEDASDLPDPWAADDRPAPALTPDQEAFLVGLEDQPPVPRLSGLAPDDLAADGDDGDDGPGATGSLPGDIRPIDS